jgi:lipopolysaccharide export system permease protein
MKINNYIATLYLKYFIIILLSLNIFNVTIETIFGEKLPDYLNIKILYLFYSLINSINSTISLVMVFSFLLVLRILINNSEVLAILSFGYKKTDILKPFLVVTFFLICISWAMSLSSLAYIENIKENVRKNEASQNKQEDIFLKQGNTYVYFKSISQIQKIANGVKIFIFDDNLEMKKIHYASVATFKNNAWILTNVKTVTFHKSKDFSDTQIITKYEKTTKVLEGFLPNIIKTIYEKGTSMSIPDAITMIALFKEQNMDTNKARSTIYSNILFPIFPIALLIIYFSYAPITSRLANMSIFNLISFTTNLCLFGLLSMFKHLSYFATGFNTELLSLLPVILLFSFAIVRYRKLDL